MRDGDGNIKQLSCKGAEERICVDHEGKINCVRVENMKFVVCDHLTAVVEDMKEAYVCLDCGKLTTPQDRQYHSADHSMKKVWIMGRE